MIALNRTYAPVAALVDELVRCGLRHAVTCPGSRNAPLVLSLAGDERLRSISVVDERSAGYLALGLAKAGGRPVGVACTSGTAAANLLPAVVEAHEARVPLIVLTADRPPELRDVGAGQAIDQLGLYGSAAKWFVEVGNHEPSRETAIHHRALGCRAYATAAGGRPGPVHLNFPLREPLAPVSEELDERDWDGRAEGRPWVEMLAARRHPSPEAVADLAELVSSARRGALVCGPGSGELATAAARLAAAAGWPLLAEPTSGTRCGPHDRSHVIAHYDALLRCEDWAGAHRPELVVRLGDAPTSKPLRAWLARTRQLVVDPHAAWHEPTRIAESMIDAEPELLCSALADALGERADPEDWVASWRRADALVPPALEGAPDPFEPKAYAALAGAVPAHSILWVGSSMPIRDVETFFPQTDVPLRFLANRGANGIDGVTSSAVGAALAAGEARTFLLTGELSLLHDLGGLLAARRHGVGLTVICVNNGGGGIFDFLPIAEHADARLYEEHVATPSGVPIAEVAALAGLDHATATTPAEVRSAALRPGLVEVRTDRAANVRLHRALFEQIAADLR